MKFSEFCKPFYSLKKANQGIIGCGSQYAISEFFMRLALGELAKIELIFSDDLFRKWFKGDRNPTDELWETALTTFDERKFSRTISGKLNINVLKDIVKSFGINIESDEIPDKYAFSNALAKQFYSIILGHGEAENILDTEYRTFINIADFSDYVRKSQSKYSKLKTLLYTSEERNFDEFFVCNTVSSTYGRYRRIPEDKMLHDITLEELAKHTRNVLLVGMGGIGKSMMMRHLFLTSIRKYSESGILPVLVTLREFSTDNNDLFNVIVDSVNRFDINFSTSNIHKLLFDGKCQILLDGLDEIKSNDLDCFLRQLDSLIDRYPNNQYVMSTRPFSSFIELSRFKVLYMLPFSNEQALELIDRLEYCPEVPKLKQQFREKLESDYCRTHAEFVTNPLLLTLMLMSYHRYSDVPEKKYLFYRQAYETLLFRHDASKLAYRRVFQSVSDPSDFTLVFREFCARSYRKGDYEFSREKIETYFDKLKCVKRIRSDNLKVESFLFDACNSACLMYEEGDKYHFLHRSFQEYFFAEYYSNADDKTLIRLGEYIRKSDQMQFDEGSAVEMLYDIAPDKVERFIIIPFLESIFDCGSKNDQYWTFICDGYKSWIYTMSNDDLIQKNKEKFTITEVFPSFRNCVSLNSSILSLVYTQLGLEDVFTLEPLGDDFKIPELITENMYGQLFSNDKDETLLGIFPFPKKLMDDADALKESGIFERLVFDENNNPEALGTMYIFDFEPNNIHSEKFSIIIDLWEKESFPAKKIFYQIEKYFHSLKQSYNSIDEFDDDDF